MTNQASEDIDNILFELIESAWSYIHKLTAAEADYIQEQAKAAIQSIIRTEKLKLLAEVRERVVGEDILAYDAPDITPHLLDLMEYQNQLRVEQRVELTKLEAEL